MNRRDLLKLAAALPITPLVFRDDLDTESIDQSDQPGRPAPLITTGVAVRYRASPTEPPRELHAPPGGLIAIHPRAIYVHASPPLDPYCSAHKTTGEFEIVESLIYEGTLTWPSARFGRIGVVSSPAIRKLFSDDGVTLIRSKNA